jgi:hypothetical protein
MKQATYFKLKQYNTYKKFIDNCAKITYDETNVLHKHHIIPKHMWINEELSVNVKSNIITLSVEHHIIAHLLLAECYETETYEYNVNLRSARILNSKSIKDVDILDKISKSYVGDKNPFYGKTHTNDVKELLANLTRTQCKGISYESRYGDRADIEKEKRRTASKNYWNSVNIHEKENRAKNISKSLKGKKLGSDNSFATKMYVDGVYYGSLTDACKSLNTTPYKLYKNYIVKKINK